MTWDPDCYRRFAGEREQPFADLIELLRPRYPQDARVKRVVDLGCGTGELSEKLQAEFKDSHVVGTDSSAEMLERARPRSRNWLTFEQRRIEDEDRRWDVIFSHAALHWVDDHRALFPRLLGLLDARGALAVQMPANHHHPSQELLRATAAEPPFAAALGGFVRESPVLPIADYAELLWRAGAVDIAVVERVYPHVLADADAVAAWLRGTTMTPYLERLPEALRAPFQARYVERLRARWPAGPVFFGFNRILLSARRT